MPNEPQPWPPIYQPEVAARAICWASEPHRSREVNVGAPTAVMRFANAIAPGLIDRYLARTGYESQQTDQPRSPNRQDNLFEPLTGDHGAHGDFDDRSTERSIQFMLTSHRTAITAVFGAVGAAGAALLLRSQRLARMRPSIPPMVRRLPSTYG